MNTNFRHHNCEITLYKRAPIDGSRSSGDFNERFGLDASIEISKFVHGCSPEFLGKQALCSVYLLKLTNEDFIDQSCVAGQWTIRPRNVVPLVQRGWDRERSAQGSRGRIDGQGEVSGHSLLNGV